MPDSALPQLTHMGLFVRDLPRMEEFYANVFSMLVTDRGESKTFKCDIVFLTADPAEHHQLVIASGRGADAPSTIFQMSFKVNSIDALRATRDRALQNGAKGMRGMNHGNALSIYFYDPEDNLVEVYRGTPFYVPQPHGEPLDLTLSDEQIMRDTEEACRRDPGFKVLADFITDNMQKLKQS